MIMKIITLLFRFNSHQQLIWVGNNLNRQHRLFQDVIIGHLLGPFDKTVNFHQKAHKFYKFRINVTTISFKNSLCHMTEGNECSQSFLTLVLIIFAEYNSSFGKLIFII